MRPTAGSLPGKWGQPGAFPALRVLGLNNTSLTGETLLGCDPA